MNKLKVKFWRIENVVLMKVLEQDESTRSKGELFKHKNIRICSEGSPEITSDTIFIRGCGIEADDRVYPQKFGTSEKAKEQLKKYIEAINAYNTSISETPTTADDIETVVVGE